MDAFEGEESVSISSLLSSLLFPSSSSHFHHDPSSSTPPPDVAIIDLRGQDEFAGEERGKAFV